MSSCLILQDKNNFYIGADTACSTNIDGKFYRYKDDVEKIFTHGDDIYFCAGDMSAVSTIVSWISRDFFGINKIDIDKISVVLREYFPYDCSDIFDIELVVCRKESGTTKIYQLSQYNHYFPIAHMPKENGLNLLCCGYKTQELYDLTYKIISYGCTDSRILYRSVFNAIYDNKVGGSLVLYKNNQPIMYEKIQENNIEYIHKNTNRHHLLIAEAVIAGYIEGSKIVGGTIQIGEYENEPGHYAFEVDESGNVSMLGGLVEFSMGDDGKPINTIDIVREALQGQIDTNKEEINNKIYDIEDTIDAQKTHEVKITVDGDTTFTNKNDQATLYCRVYLWNQDITNEIPETLFQWHRTSATTKTFIGNGTYSMFYIGIDDRYVNGSVFVDNELIESADYTYDIESGYITFNMPPSADSMIEVLDSFDTAWANELDENGKKKRQSKSTIITCDDINENANFICKVNI